MKAVTPRVDVVDPVLILPVDYKQDVRQCIGRVRIVSNCQRVKLRPRGNRG